MATTLADRLVEERQLSPKEAVRIGIALAREVERLRRQGSDPGKFGPASVTLQGGQVNLGAGDADLVSPEEAAGRPVDERTDVYRLGAIMYAMLTGNPPPAPPPAKITTAPRLRPPEPPPSVHAVRRDVNRALDEAITRALSRDPRDRFARAGHFADMLEESLHQRLDHQPHSDRPSQVAIVDSWEFQEEERRTAARQRRKSTERRALLLLVVLSAVLAGVLYWG